VINFWSLVLQKADILYIYFHRVFVVVVFVCGGSCVCHSACRAGILFQHCVCVCLVTTAILIDRLLATSVNMHSDGPLCAKWSIYIRLLGTLASQKYGTAASMVLPTLSSQKLWSHIMSAGCCHLHKTNGYICACVDMWPYNAHVVNTKGLRQRHNVDRVQSSMEGRMTWKGLEVMLEGPNRWRPFNDIKIIGGLFFCKPVVRIRTWK